MVAAAPLFNTAIIIDRIDQIILYVYHASRV